MTQSSKDSCKSSIELLPVWAAACTVLLGECVFIFLNIYIFKKWHKNLSTVPFWTYCLQEEDGSNSCCSDSIPYSPLMSYNDIFSLSMVFYADLYMFCWVCTWPFSSVICTISQQWINVIPTHWFTKPIIKLCTHNQAYCICASQCTPT